MARIWKGERNVRVALFDATGDFTVVGKYFNGKLVTLKIWAERVTPLYDVADRWRSTPDEITNTRQGRDLMVGATIDMYDMMRHLGLPNPERWR